MVDVGGLDAVPVADGAVELHGAAVELYVVLRTAPNWADTADRRVGACHHTLRSPRVNDC